MNPRKLLDWRKLLIYSHRWLGILLGILFLAWFVSGIFFMYWGMPHLSAQERLLRMRPLDLSSIHITPFEAAEFLHLKSPTRLRVAMLGRRPVYRILSAEGWTTIYADTGEPLRAMNALHATNTLRYFVPEYAQTLHYDEYLTDSDQWTLQSVVRNLMPLHRIALNDEADTYYYVSERTGEPVLKTDSAGRMRGYLSGVLHWMYFTPLRRHTQFWNTTIVWASFIGCVMCLAGLFIGVWRFSLSSRFRLKRVHSHSPYAGMMKWHHYAGLLFGVFTFTWAFSGALSLTPFPSLRGSPETRAPRDGVPGGAVDLKPLTNLRIRGAVEEISKSFVPKELELLQFRGQPYFMAYQAPSEPAQWKNTSISDFISLQVNLEQAIVPALKPDMGSFKRFNDQDVFEVACESMPGITVKDSTWLNEYDAYYYSQDRTRPLPVLRVRFNDPQQTWLYLNPYNGQIIRNDRMSRLNRWLYKGLHDFDFPFLVYRRPLWDITVIFLSVGGIVLSVATLMPAFRRLRRHARKLFVRGLRSLS